MAGGREGGRRTVLDVDAGVLLGLLVWVACPFGQVEEGRCVDEIVLFLVGVVVVAVVVAASRKHCGIQI